MKIHLTAVIKAKEEHRSEVLEVLRNMVKETRKEEACELYNLHQELKTKTILYSTKSGKAKRVSTA